MRRREFLCAASAAIPGMGAFPLGHTARAAAKTDRLLYYTRSVGFEHSVVRRQGEKPSHSERVLAELARRLGFEVECTKDCSTR